MPYLNFYSTKPGVKFLITILTIITIGIIISFSGLLFSRLIFWLHLDQVNDVLYGRYDLLSNAQLRYYQAVQTVGYFLVPGFFLYWIFSDESNAYFDIKQKPEYKNVFIIFLILFVAIPFISWLFLVNQKITLPAAFSGLEETLQKIDQKYIMLTERLVSGNTIGQFLINLVVIAILPAVGEELIFRGVIQRIFTESFRNAHIAVVLAALLFSAVHGQFYGFIPRFFLGLFFGYTMVWGRSIWYPVLAHFLNNGILITISFIAKQGSISDKFYTDSGDITYLLSTTSISISVVLSIAVIYLLRKRMVLNRSTNS